MLAFKKEKMKEGPRAGDIRVDESWYRYRPLDKGQGQREQTRKFPDATRDTSPVEIELNNNISKRAIVPD